MEKRTKGTKRRSAYAKLNEISPGVIYDVHTTGVGYNGLCFYKEFDFRHPVMAKTLCTLMVLEVYRWLGVTAIKCLVGDRILFLRITGVDGPEKLSVDFRRITEQDCES